MVGFGSFKRAHEQNSRHPDNTSQKSDSSYPPRHLPALAVLFRQITKTQPCRATAYLASDLVVVQVHQGPGVLLDLPRVDEHLGEAQAVADVGRAAAPLPALVDAVEALLLLVAAAVAQVALRAGGRDGVGHARRDDGVREGGLFAAWQKKAEQRRGEGRSVGRHVPVVRSRAGFVCFFFPHRGEKNYILR